MLTELKNRGVADVLMIVCDGLACLPDAITTVWPQAITQTCVVHLLHNSFRYTGRQHWAVIAKALKPVYTSPTEAAGRERFAEFTEAWGALYPAIVRLWDNAWAEFVPLLAFDPEIRRVIRSTNATDIVMLGLQVGQDAQQDCDDECGEEDDRAAHGEQRLVAERWMWGARREGVVLVGHGVLFLGLVLSSGRCRG